MIPFRFVAWWSLQPTLPFSQGRWHKSRLIPNCKINLSVDFILLLSLLLVSLHHPFFLLTFHILSLSPSCLFFPPFSLPLSTLPSPSLLIPPHFPVSSYSRFQHLFTCSIYLLYFLESLYWILHTLWCRMHTFCILKSEPQVDLKFMRVFWKYHLWFLITSKRTKKNHYQCVLFSSKILVWFWEKEPKTVFLLLKEMNNVG